MMTGLKIKMNINADEIVETKKLKLAQRFLTSEVRRLSDKYIPFDNGPLKNTAIESIDSITYIQPYAKRQFYENKGYGTQGTAKGGLRGKQWTNRMWADRGKEITKSVANLIGGKVK